MTREEFLQALREALHGMADDEIDGVIGYYGELIDDSIEAGMTQQAAVGAMEPVDVIASRVLSEAGVEKEKQPEATGEDAGDSNEKVIRRSAQNIHVIRVTTSNQRVLIKSHEDDDIIFRYVIDPGDVYRLHENNGELTLEYKRKPIVENPFVNTRTMTVENILENVSKFLSNLDFSALTVQNRPSRVIEVTLPRVFRGKVCVSTSNARVQMDNVTCVEEITLNTSNARIVMSSIVARRVTASTSNGRVELRDVYAKNAVQATTSNGRLVAVKAASEEALTLITSNGRIEVEGIEAPSIKLHTSNGAITGTIKGTPALYGLDNMVMAHKSVLTNGENAQKRLSAGTSNGSVTLRFEE